MYIIFILFCVIFADDDHVIVHNLYNHVPMYIIFILFHVNDISCIYMNVFLYYNSMNHLKPYACH